MCLAGPYNHFVFDLKAENFARTAPWLVTLNTNYDCTNIHQVLTSHTSLKLASFSTISARQSMSVVHQLINEVLTSHTSLKLASFSPISARQSMTVVHQLIHQVLPHTPV